MSEYKIEIRDLYKIFGPNPKAQIEKVKAGVGKQELLDEHGHVLGLQDVNINIPGQKIQVIMGLSGSGKSTLIRHINRLIEPTHGELLVDGKDVLAMNDQELQQFRRFGASMVFQKFALLPHRTVIENGMYGLNIQGVSEDEARPRAQKWLDRVGLTGFEDRYPAQLSGGMQQRVGLARALATDAEILLMDEAFSALDPLIRMDMQDVLLGLQNELHKTIVFITHDLDEALRLGDDIVILRDGRIVQSGSPDDIVLHPVDDYVADFTKDVNRSRVLHLGVLSSGEVSGEGLELPASMALEEAMQALAASDHSRVTVMSDSGPKGQVTMSDMVTAISRPKLQGNGDVTYR